MTAVANLVLVTRLLLDDLVFREINKPRANAPRKRIHTGKGLLVR